MISRETARPRFSLPKTWEAEFKHVRVLLVYWRATGRWTAGDCGGGDGTEPFVVFFPPGPSAVGASPTATSLWQPLIGCDARNEAPAEGGWVQLEAPVRKESTNQIVPPECFRDIPGLGQTVSVTLINGSTTLTRVRLV